MFAMKVISRNDYVDMIVNLTGSPHSLESELSKEQHKRIFLALTYALKNRKNEIELYWKRAQYFWGFLATILGGYLFAFRSIASSSKPSNILDPIVLFVIAFVGFLFSLGWLLSNRGSAFWQENWEYHVRELEKEIYGPLHSIIATNTNFYSTKSFHAPFPYSVNKINCFLSLLFVILSLLFASVHLFSIFKFLFANWIASLTLTMLSLTLILVISKTFIQYAEKGCVAFCKENCSDKRHPIFFSDHNTKS